MIDYSVGFTYTNAVAFPGTKGVNASTPTSLDGTEFVALMVDDEWGARQALVNYAGLTPSGSTEIDGASQALEAIQKGFIGPGTGIHYWKNDDPATLGDRVLLLNGQGILRANYTELDAAVYVGDVANPTASAFYRADNADGSSRNVTGIYLILPETRGYVLRGLDVAAAVDPDGASRDLGSIQADAFESHLHTGWVSAGNIAASGVNVAPVSAGNTGSTGDPNETRMINVATTFGIVY
jgi:hypothetical protein